MSVSVIRYTFKDTNFQNIINGPNTAILYFFILILLNIFKRTATTYIRHFNEIPCANLRNIC